MSRPANSLIIVDGPSRDLLWDHVKYAYDKDVRFPLSFKLEQDGVAKNYDSIVIHSIQHESGSGYSFNLKGWLNVERGSIDFVAYYDAKRRTGNIQLTRFSF